MALGLVLLEGCQLVLERGGVAMHGDRRAREAGVQELVQERLALRPESRVNLAFARRAGMRPH